MGEQKIKDNSLTFKWLNGILVAVLFIMVGAWATSLSNRTAIVEGEHKQNEPRIIKLETQYEEIQRRLENIDRKLDTNFRKLDAIK